MIQEGSGECLARIIHDGWSAPLTLPHSMGEGRVGADKREERLVCLVYSVCPVYLVCLVEPDRPDEPDEPDQLSLVALFQPVSPVLLESGIRYSHVGSARSFR